MTLPYASPYLTEIALEALRGATFRGDVVDQYLTMLAMDGHEYVGDFETIGTASLLELDNEDRVVLTLLDLVAECRGLDLLTDPGPSSFANDAAVILWSVSCRWWAEPEWFTSMEDARARYAAFEAEWLMTLPCEDCGSEDAASCVCDAEPAPESCDVHLGRPHATGGLTCELYSAEAFCE